MVTVPWHANANRYSALTYGFLCLFLLTTLGSVLYATYKDRETQLERYSQRVQLVQVWQLRLLRLLLLVRRFILHQLRLPRLTRFGCMR